MKLNQKESAPVNLQTMYLSIAILVLVLLIMFVGFLWYGTLQRAATPPVIEDQAEAPSVSNTHTPETDEEVFARLRRTATTSSPQTESDAEVFERLSKGPSVLPQEDEAFVVE